MTATISTLSEADNHFVLGETLRPLLTNAMGSSIEVFDTTVGDSYGIEVAG